MFIVLLYDFRFMLAIIDGHPGRVSPGVDRTLLRVVHSPRPGLACRASHPRIGFRLFRLVTAVPIHPYDSLNISAFFCCMRL